MKNRRKTHRQRFETLPAESFADLAAKSLRLARPGRAGLAAVAGVAELFSCHSHSTRGNFVLSIAGAGNRNGRGPPFGRPDRFGGRSSWIAGTGLAATG